MNLAALRAVILVTELLTFLMVTAVMTYFISFVAAPEFAPGSEPPADFPVIAYDGDREKPDAKRYRVMPWSDWQSYAERNPGASLLLPEPSRAVQVGNEDQASFVVTDGGDSRQTVELTWRSGSEERRARYIAQARSLEPRSLHTINTRTFLLAALAGFAAGMLIGRFMRRRWLPRPGDIIALPPTSK
jgi:hypothetical protein